MSRICFVRNCRFSDKHTTENHQCGGCGQFGHGRMECGHPEMIQALHSLCKVRGCRFSDKHSTNNHKCGGCGQFGHGRMECELTRLNIPQNACIVECTQTEFAVREGRKFMGETHGKIFAVVYAGMGCQWFVKRDSRNGMIDTFFMHTDAWGQYGPQSDDRHKLVAFLNGYVFHEDGKPFTLPQS